MVLLIMYINANSAHVRLIYPIILSMDGTKEYTLSDVCDIHLSF